MARTPKSMRHILEVLRLKYQHQLTVREIARSSGLPVSTVGDYVQRFQAAGLTWPLPEGLGEAGRRLAGAQWSGVIISNPNPRDHRQVANRVRCLKHHALYLRTSSNRIPRPVAVTHPITPPRTLIKPEHVLVLGMCVEQLGDTSIGNTDRSLSTQVRLPLLVQTPQNLLPVATVPSQVIDENHVFGAAISHAYDDNQHNRSHDRRNWAAAHPCPGSYHR